MDDDQVGRPGAPDRRPDRRWPLPDVRPGAPAPDGTLFASDDTPPARARPVAPPFPLVRRGYHPGHVDAHLAELAAHAAAVDTERQRAEIAEDQLREALTELKSARAEPGHGVPDSRGPAGSDGFGVRAERVLREAAREAEQERAAAVEQAGAILAQAREQAAAHSREVERAAAERHEEIERELRRRSDAVAGREQELDRQEDELATRTASAAAESEALLRAAEQDAAERARAVLDGAEREAAARRERSMREIERLRRVRSRVRAELARLHGDLGSRLELDELDAPVLAAGSASPSVTSVA